ncbi:MAG: hypothetical protein WCD69_25535 [Xanthobacteraceae bacterium]
MRTNINQWTMSGSGDWPIGVRALAADHGVPDSPKATTTITGNQLSFPDPKFGG